MTERRAVWLDCDPGHDDAIAILLALFAPAESSASLQQSALRVLGISSVHGNASGTRTFINTLRLLSAYKIDASQCEIWRGADIPLLRQAKADVAIHGEDGLGGVECLPDIDSGDSYVQGHLQSCLKRSNTDDSSYSAKIPPPSPLSLVSHLLEVLQRRLQAKLPPISIIATGPLTNIALLIKMCPGSDLQMLRQTVKDIVIMGGAAGTPGNRSPLAGEM
jgi:inosine-uridine nucleoside N-ribohydrolase